MARIPLQPEARAVRALSFVVTTLMVALGIAALAAAATLRHVDLDWRAALAGRWTVELPPAAPPPPGGALAPDGPPAKDDSAARAVAAIRAIPGIADAHVIAADEVRRLLQPWLGDMAALPELPLPTLIDVRLAPDQPADSTQIGELVAKAVPGATLDDHGRWTEDLARLAGTGEGVGLMLFAVAVIVAALTVAAVARTRLAVNRPEIALLHQIGASDGYIARQFQRDILRSTLPGAVLGTGLAALAGFALIKKGVVYAPLLPRLRLETVDWVALAAVPLGAVLLTGLVAQATAWALVRRLP
jgi:cell division transport system permease protein